ncbi:hypothetical protein ASPZODRAFT_138921 [Penicilliopsis zonata CBS 506.65]|uniref:Carboxypeptidase n=1 Tax=Penicilliopsis zonata CBS 506.65 TaxID=1073090 RepID=A0A1L9SQM7_9EURO|nr:hypothetical protein ASPZODRAFT_138921 [Penicilliopsis zonata CBS 506.65]OJJ49532.1 hypothetical protein ASPZODRAFT_138921 [Penicilliopsis zonata CBS 506.65]
MAIAAKNNLPVFMGLVVLAPPLIEPDAIRCQIGCRLLCEVFTWGAGRSAVEDACRGKDAVTDGIISLHRHIEVDAEHNGNLFFWHYQNRHIADRQRTVIWLNGGPGCSSMDGALMEVGPYRLKDDHTLEYNEGSWDEFAHLLFVDQPVGTGFSYVNTDSYIHELTEMSAHFITFLEKWFELFPQYEDDDIYIAGESYAGQHIPYIAKAIQERNRVMTGSNRPSWKIKGLLIGNGWISPAEQYPSYLSFAYKEGLVKEHSKEAKAIEATQSLCLSLINAPGGKDKVDIPECESILREILDASKQSNQCYNMYDIRLKDDYPSCGMNWPTDLVNVEPYLRLPEVTKALHINPDKKTGWQECSGAVSSTFTARNSKPAVQFLPSLIESGIPVLLFSGDRDLICNHIGTEQMIHNMKWGGGTGFETSPGVWAPRHQWTFEGEPAGLYQFARNLTYVLLYNSSHMVPYDLPRQSRDMLDRFMNVDIGSIGGSPADSRIDGEKLPLTSVGGHPNSTAAEEQEKQKMKEAEWKAYAKSGEAVLVVVIVVVSVWGFLIWRNRRRESLQRGAYRGIYADNQMSMSALDRFGNKNRHSATNGDIEAGDFDEAELDRLDPPGEREHYSVGDESEEEYEDMHQKPATR